VANETFDRDFWERRWAQVLREHPDKVASRPPNAHLLADVEDMAAGRALDAGCGHGAEAIWPGGTLFLVGHLPVDPATGEPTPAAGQVQVSVDDAVEALDSREWQIVVAEERPRTAAGTGRDAVVRAVYQP